MLKSTDTVDVPDSTRRVTKRLFISDTLTYHQGPILDREERDEFHFATIWVCHTSKLRHQKALRNPALSPLSASSQFLQPACKSSVSPPGGDGVQREVQWSFQNRTPPLKRWRLFGRTPRRRGWVAGNCLFGGPPNDKPSLVEEFLSIQAESACMQERRPHVWNLDLVISALLKSPKTLAQVWFHDGNI